MASSSSTFEVFLSFKGEDTRYTFTDRLFENLDRMGINTFRDDQLERGEATKSELLKTIEESRISIIVFSKNYAHSKWCLDELAKIMECREEMDQIVLPVFYHVDPSDVRSQTGSYGEAFSIHARNIADEKRMQRWKDSLTAASNLSGFHVNDGYESKHIKEILNEISKRLNPKQLHIQDEPVGIDFHLNKLKSLLNTHLNDIRAIGIYGIGGIGKTTIAKIVYNETRCQFIGASFLQDVRERSKNGCQLQLQRQLLHDIVGNDVEISNVNEGINIIQSRLRSKNILIVIDDVYHLKQLEPLAGSLSWFGLGSRIIITTRDQHLLLKYGVTASYEVTKLHDEEALKLFNQHAFKQGVPQEGYVDISNCMMHYAQGLPLALKVLGSYLRGMKIDEWKKALDKFKRSLMQEINDVLRISFDGLDQFEKEVFLDIACFFKRECKDVVLKILDGCNLFATCGISVLQDRCLVTIVDNVIQMHDLIQQMGWTVIREECPGKPSKWSRLWDRDHIYDAFSTEEGMENIQTISLRLSELKEIQFTTKVFATMKKLRLLKIYGGDDNDLMRKEYKVILPKNFEFPHNLRYLHWQGCNLRYLPSKFCGENLIEINLKSSSLKQLWKDNQCLRKLKVIDLSNSKHLVKMPKFWSMPNLERLNLEGCTNLRELDSSIGDLKNLAYLNLGGCEELQSFPTTKKLESLEVLYLNDCPNLKKFPEIHGCMEHLTSLYLNGSGIKEIPSSIVDLASLEVLDLSNCYDLVKFPEIHRNMKFLRRLYLEKCTNFEKFPDIFTNMGQLRELLLSESGIKELPKSIGYLEYLEILDLGSCSKFEKFPEIKGNMKCLKDLLLYRTAIKELPNSIERLQGLEILDLHGCSKFEKFPEIKGNHMQCLREIQLQHTAIKELPDGIGCLEALEEIRLSGCSNFERFPEIQTDKGNLQALYLDGTAIQRLPYSIGHLSRLSRLKLQNCGNLTSLPNSIYGLKSLRNLSLNGCSNLEAFSEIEKDMEKLKSLCLSGTGIIELSSSIERLRCLDFLELFNCENLVALPDSIGNLTCLTTLVVRNCPKLHYLPDNLRSLQCCLEMLDLAGCNLMEGQIPSDLWCLYSLEDLDLSENLILRIPSGITQLCKLHTLIINHCPLLKEIGELPPSLTTIQAHGCPCLEIETSSSHLWSSLLKYFKSPTQWTSNIIIPGRSGIPEWVSHRRMGSSKIRIELPMNWYEDDNLLGFALFFYHVPIEEDDDNRYWEFGYPKCGWISNDDESESMDGLFYDPRCKTYWIRGLNESIMKSYNGSTRDPAISIAYIPQTAIPSRCRSKRWNNFETYFRTPTAFSFSCGEDIKFKVESCGIHLIYAHHDHSNNVINWPQPSRDTKHQQDRKRFFSFQGIIDFLNPTKRKRTEH